MNKMKIEALRHRLAIALMETEQNLQRLKQISHELDDEFKEEGI